MQAILIVLYKNFNKNAVWFSEINTMHILQFITYFENKIGENNWILAVNSNISYCTTYPFLLAEWIDKHISFEWCAEFPN